MHIWEIHSEYKGIDKWKLIGWEMIYANTKQKKL